MTAPTYQADDDQLVQAHDPAISEESLTEPDADLAEPRADLTEPHASLAAAAPDLAEPDADPMPPDADLADLTEPDADLATAEADLTEPDADQAAHEDLTSPAGAVALADSEPAASMVPGYPGFIPDGDHRVAEPVMAGGSIPASAPLISAAFTVPESATDSHPAGDTAPAPGPWNEIQAMFVDDPRASIERAAGLADDRVEEYIQSVRERQHSMQSAWQADDAGTEELRVALQQYRGFWNSLEDLPARD